MSPNQHCSCFLTGDKMCKMLDDKLDNYIAQYGKKFGTSPQLARKQWSFM